jgi:secreted PhoX family phosphatase
MDNSRRNFLRNSTLVSLGFVGLNTLASDESLSNFSKPEVGYGPLEYQTDEILSLPKGFSSTIISRKGDKMNDGLITPGAYDGMGVFRHGDDKIILIRNHEISPGAHHLGPFGLNHELLSTVKKDKIYDYGKGDRTCVGGTSTMVYNELSKKVELEYLSLVGTVRNCAGGITPWRSWITCEETPLRTGDEDGMLEKDHGYNFEVTATDKIGLADPVPLKAMGRFVHEAVAVHPTAGIVYQTEDRPDGNFYRFLPNQKGKLQAGGKLQCLGIQEWPSADARNWESLETDKFPEKRPYKVKWIDLDNVEAPDNDLRLRGFQKGATRFSSAEGIWYGKNELFFACTSGGRNKRGQIFKYTPSRFEGQPKEKQFPGTIELFMEPNNTEIFQSCDNLTVSPWGDVIICEDKADARIIGITPKGKTYVIAKNVGFNKSEFAGPVFSPSGKTLFVNIQFPGLTLAITGPWKELNR